MLLLLLRSGPGGGGGETHAGLFEAAAAWLAADPGLASLCPGGVWADDAPPEGEDGEPLPLPYAVVSEPDGDDDDESDGASVEAVRLQLSVFAAGKAAARRAREAATEALEDAPLSFEDGTLLHLRAAERTGLKDPDRGPGGCDVWQEIQFFDAVVGRG